MTSRWSTLIDGPAQVLHSHLRKHCGFSSRCADPPGRRVSMFPAIIVALSLCGASLTTHSADWKPGKPIEIVAAAAPGGGYDRMARTLQRIWQLSKVMLTPVTVVNKAGGGGAVGWAYLNQHAGDGHYLSTVSPPLLTNNLTGSSPLSFRDLTPLAVLGTESVVLTVRADSPIRNGRDLIERMRKDPAGVVIGLSPGLGTHSHIGIVMPMKAAGVDVRKMRSVVYASGGEAATALLGGHVAAVSSTPGNVLPQIQAGNLRAIALTAPQRVVGPLADVPTWREQGVEAVFSNWRGIVGPKQLGAAQTAFWDEIFAKLAQSDDWKKDLEDNLLEPLYLNSTEMAKFLEAENDQMRAVLSDLGMAK